MHSLDHGRYPPRVPRAYIARYVKDRAIMNQRWRDPPRVQRRVGRARWVCGRSRPEAPPSWAGGCMESTLRTANERDRGIHYKWIALSNTTLGILMAALNSSIVLIALPTIFNGIHINPLSPGNTSFLL